MSVWWIDEPFLLGSSNPSEAQLQGLYGQGLRIVISLLDDTEQPPRYDPRHAMALGFTRYSIPIPDFGTPSLDQMYQFIDWLAAVPLPEKVLVHCEGGAGRTGTMAAVYWISKGASAADAIHKVRQANSDAVETKGQVRMLNELENDCRQMRLEALDTFRRLVALLYREIGVLNPRNHPELAGKRKLESGFFATPARKTMPREVYQRTKLSPDLEATVYELQALTGLSLHDIESAFREGAWGNGSGGYSYGGPKWAAIASATRSLRDAIVKHDTSRMRHVLDEIGRLEHNNGRIVTKFSELGPS
jgi:atypical dual specificity phosphatase